MRSRIYYQSTQPENNLYWQPQQAFFTPILDFIGGYNDVSVNYVAGYVPPWTEEKDSSRSVNQPLSNKYTTLKIFYPINTGFYLMLLLRFLYIFYQWDVLLC